MNTVRVYDLATKFRLTTKEVLDRLQAAGLEANTFSSAVEEQVAVEILSKPLAKIPAHSIRPGAPAPAKAKPAPRRAPRTKAAASAEGAEAPAPAKPRVRAKAAAAADAAGEVKAEPKPRTRKATAAAAKAAASRPLVVTLEAPTLEHTVTAPAPEPVPEIALFAPAPAPAVEAPPVEAAPAPPPLVEAPPAPPAVAVPVEVAPAPAVVAAAELVTAVEPPPAPAPPGPPVTTAPTIAPPAARPVAEAPAARPAPPPPPAPHRREAPRPAARPPRPEPAKEARPRPASAEAAPRPAVEPPRPVVASAAPPDAGVLEAPPAPAFVPPAEPVIAPPRERRAPVKEAPPRAAKAAPPPPPAPPAPPVVKVLKVGEGMSPKELAEKMSAAASDVIKRLIKMGVLATINTSIDAETVSKVAQQFGYTVERASPEDLVEEPPVVEAPALLKARAPVITVMGHVDHGKTSLLDAIRHTNVTASEAGGITQHIGAYEVEVPGHAVSRVVFLDTPGHEAFTAMRARGAQATDIVVLVVAADDGVMPQTIEAINHAKAAKVPILVAVNKIDKPNADPNRIKQQLTEYGLVPEEWGGETIFVPVSAKRREGIQELLDNLLVLAEVQEFKANPDKPGRGLVIEAELDKGRGPVATILVQAGSLRVGDAVVAGLHHGRVRAMINDRGKKVHEAGPATPVEILGLSGVPLAGDTFAVVGDERKARQIALARQEKQRQEMAATQPRMTLDALHQQIQQGEVKELRLILKGDVQGSVEPLRESLERLATEQVTVKVLHTSVGAITESDVMLAAASNAIVVGFNVRPEPKAQRLAEQERVDLRMYTIIYEAINQIKAAMEGLLEPTFVEKPLGRVEVRQLFNITKVGTVAGSFVADGKVAQSARVRVVRDGKVVHEGKILSLRRFKQDVSEVLSGQECGISLANYNDVHPGDVLEVFELQEVAPKL
jgi:translation initiation factor IF-2